MGAVSMQQGSGNSLSGDSSEGGVAAKQHAASELAGQRGLDSMKELEKQHARLKKLVA